MIEAEVLVEQIRNGLVSLHDASEAMAQASIAIAIELRYALKMGYPVLIAGNGGTSALSSHFVGDLIHMVKWSKSPIHAPLADSSVVTALANDFGYAEGIARVVSRLESGVVLLVSTSGESENCLVAAKAVAELQGVRSIALVGRAGSSLGSLVDVEGSLGIANVQLAQEAMTIVVHQVCALCAGGDE